jgi:hypothetical protein
LSGIAAFLLDISDGGSAARHLALAAGAWVGTSHPDSGWLQYLRPYAAGLLLVATLSQPPNQLSPC